MIGAIPESPANSEPSLSGKHDESLLTNEGADPGMVDELGRCPLGNLQSILHMVSLYDRCCFGGTSSKLQAAVLCAHVGIPVTLATVRADPDALLTPLFRRMLSVLLEFHLPAACPHRTVFHHSDDGVLRFICCSCQGALQFQEAVVLPLLLRAAFSTALEHEQQLRRRCLQFLSGSGKPSVTCMTVPLPPPCHGRKSIAANMQKGHLCNLVLKATPSTLQSALDNVSQKPKAGYPIIDGSGCEVCGGYGSDDGFRGYQRTGRRKTRRGMRDSRMLTLTKHECICFATCE